MVNVKYNGDLASPSLVRLYDYSQAKDFDKSYEGVIHYGIYRELMDKGGNIITPKYTSDSFVGVNTFEDIDPGNYIAIIMYKPSGFSYENFFYYGYKEIVVNSKSNAKLYNCRFSYETERGEWVVF